MCNPISRLSIAFAAVVLNSAALTISPVQASIVTYDFTVNVTQGPLAGQSYGGTFSYDDATLEGAGVETLGIEQDLSVCMNYFGRNYTEVDDTSYPDFPTLIFEDGAITQLDFWVQPNQRINWWDLPGWEVNLSERPADADVPACQEQ
ncbi:hypothetical protein H6F88_31460 [Oculatella sp. FACHB-28]|nr:hypothetical protein [Oculatella sp. FACHB-28]